MGSLESQLLLLVLAQIIFVAAILIAGKRVRPTIFLFLLIECLFIQTLMKVINKLWLMETFQRFYYLGYDIPFLFGPLLLMFIRSKLSPQRSASPILFLPFGVGLILSWYRLDILENLSRNSYFIFFACVGLCQMLVLLICVGAALRSINKATQTLDNRAAANLDWCRRLVASTMIVSAFLIVYLRIAYIFSPFLYLPFLYIPFFLALLAIAVYALHEPEYYSDAVVPELNKTKYARSALSESEIELFGQRLFTLMDDDKLFLDPELSVERLAEILDTSRHKLSQFLNHVLKKTYSEYINEMRIGEARRLLIDPDMHQYTLQAVAEGAGFNSYTTFFQVFKRLVGMTPHDYKKAYSKTDNSTIHLNGVQRHPELDFL